MKVRKMKGSKVTTVKRRRVGAEMVVITRTVEKFNLIVDFYEILEACEVINDEDHDAPWKNDDGWDHKAIRSRYDWRYEADVSKMRGHLPSNRDYDLIIPQPEKAGLPDYSYFRSRGCSKQVAREMAAQAVREYLDQLVEWYEHGWNYYGVTCEFMGYTSGGLWGLDDYNYASYEVCMEQAEEVAEQMEKDGFIITNKPKDEPRLGSRWTKSGFLDHLKRNITLDCWA